MDAEYFRDRASVARELARNGEDARLIQMLLEVAADMDAEADAIEAENAAPRALKHGVAGGGYPALREPSPTGFVVTVP